MSFIELFFLGNRDFVNGCAVEQFKTNMLYDIYHIPVIYVIYCLIP